MKDPWKWYVYILECKSGKYYVGMTWNISNRWEQHLSLRGSGFTSKEIPEKMVYMEEYVDFDEARKREKQLKGWTRLKKEKLITGEWKKLGW